MDKKFSVKGFQYSDVENKTTKMIHRVRKLIVLGTDLCFADAKALRNKLKGIGASIFPNVIKTEEEIIDEKIQAGEVVTL